MNKKLKPVKYGGKVYTVQDDGSTSVEDDPDAETCQSCGKIGFPTFIKGFCSQCADAYHKEIRARKIRKLVDEEEPAEHQIEQEVQRQSRQARARELVADERAMSRARMPLGFPDDDGSLADDLAAEQPPIRFQIDQMAGTGHIASMPSTRKTGKTTFLANLACAGVSGGMFLNTFQTHLTGCVGIWNAEMEQLDYTDVFRPIRPVRADRIRTLHLRGYSVPFLSSESVAEQTVKWLTTHEVEWWFLDPWKNVCSWNQVGLNDNTRVQALLERIQEIQREAHVSLVVIPMHTTQSSQEDGFERGKGAGEFEDGVDVMWRYVKVNPQRDADRVLTVEGRGRGIGLDETQVVFDPGNGSLTLGTGNRYEARENRLVEAVVEAVAMFNLQNQRRPSTRDIRSSIRGRTADIDDALKKAESQGKIRSETAGRAILWSLNGSMVPDGSGRMEPYGSRLYREPYGNHSGTGLPSGNHTESKIIKGTILKDSEGEE